MSTPDRTAQIPFRRLVDVELRKLADTRSALWLLVSIALIAVGAVAVLVLFAPFQATYADLANTVAYPLGLLVPMVGLLSITSEWSQRGALTTFTLVPRRGRVIAAKAACVAGLTVVATALTFGLAACGALLSAAAEGTAPVWNLSWADHLYLFTFQAIGVAVGFTLGAILRRSSVALVGYLMFALVVPSLSSQLALGVEWYGDIAPWLDLTHAQYALLGETVTGEQWTQLGITAALWIAIPFALGLWRLRRVEIR